MQLVIAVIYVRCLKQAILKVIKIDSTLLESASKNVTER